MVLDSVTGRVIPWLSLLGSGMDTIDGKPITKSQQRLPIHIGSSLFRRFECVEGCLVCCAVLSISLDYIPTEKAWEKVSVPWLFKPRTIVVNGRHRQIMSHDKEGRRDHAKRETNPDKLKSYCTFLAPVRNGSPGCSLWRTGSPLGCASAYNMRVSEQPDRVLITKQGMARAWRYDPAPECEFHDVPLEESDIDTNIHLLGRFLEWAQYFEMKTSIERIHHLIILLDRIKQQGRVTWPLIVP